MRSGSYVLLTLLVGRAALAQAPVVQGGGVAKPEEQPKAGTIITTEPGEGEKVADEGGQIYVSRGYKGVVPGVRDSSPVPAKAAPAGPAPRVQWIGFQPFATYSRVFVQVEGEYKFTVVRAGPELIELRVPNATLSTQNDARQLVTRMFPTAIDEVTVAPPTDSEGVVVKIRLKKPVGYLYRSEGKYIFVDVEL